VNSEGKEYSMAGKSCRSVRQCASVVKTLKAVGLTLAGGEAGGGLARSLASGRAARGGGDVHACKKQRGEGRRRRSLLINQVIVSILVFWFFEIQRVSLEANVILRRRRLSMPRTSHKRQNQTNESPFPSCLRRDTSRRHSQNEQTFDDSQPIGG
jgi:hypothetical protein